jgi:flagellar M-ring protein FliF
VHEPRSAEELQQLEALVRGAAGLDDGRGDRVEIVSRRFVQPDLAGEAEDTLLGLPHESYWRAAELATYALLTLLVLLLGVRPLLRRLFPSQEPAPSVSALTGVATPLLAQTAADPGAGEPLLEDGTARLPDGPGTTVALRNVLGQVKASLVEEVAGFVNQHPDEAVRVVRGWLHGK